MSKKAQTSKSNDAQGPTHRRLLEAKEEDDDNIASMTPSELSDIRTEGIQERKKAGRPLKKFRGRFAKQKKAIRDAKIAEKVAIKQRELPVLDLTLRVIDHPTIELPLEVPIVNSPIIHETALLHEVGEVLKELVVQVSLEELQPKRDIKPRSRRCWEEVVPKRIRSKRQEYRNSNIPAADRSPTPPPLIGIGKPRGRNSEKYRQAAIEQAKHQNGDQSAPDTTDLETLPAWESKPLYTSQEDVAETQDEGSEDVGIQVNHPQP